MNLSLAQDYAKKIVKWIQPYCAAMPVIAGSIRRGRPVCNDVDIVCLPKIAVQKDMFGETISSKNLLIDFINGYVANPDGQSRIQSAGEKCMIIQLPKCQLDLWFATAETLATRTMCRTGSMHHNIWLASRAKRLGLKWNPYEGILHSGQWREVGDRSEYCNGIIQRFATETDLYRMLGLPFIAPENRELDFLNSHFRSDI
jgi:DNA polymerase/3'-5' exonuclease PolX